jgi:zinc transport system ATP-binding protein
MGPRISVDQLSWGTPSGERLGHDLSLQLNAGEVLWIEGENGTGKSSFLRVLLGESAPLHGWVRLSVPFREVGYLPQVHHWESPIPILLSDIVSRQNITKLKDRYQIDLSMDTGSRQWSSASGGEQQRILLIRELIRFPKILILDEPLNHLDARAQARVRALIGAALVSKAPPAVVIVSHQSFATAGHWVSRGQLLTLLQGGKHRLQPISAQRESGL